MSLWSSRQLTDGLEKAIWKAPWGQIWRERATETRAKSASRRPPIVPDVTVEETWPWEMEQDIVCGTCIEFLSRPDEDFPYGDSETQRPAFYTLATIRASVADGCRLCTLILDTFSRKYQDMEEDAQISATIKIERSPDVSINIHAEIDRGDLHSEEEDTSASVVIRSNCSPLPGSIKNPMVGVDLPLLNTWHPPNSWSEDSCQLIHAWLQSCLSTHAKCIPRLHQRKRRLPTRLINVRADTDLTCQLVVTAKDGFDPESEYLTLSHRWGDKILFKLLNSNIARLRQRLPFEELSQTFKDAIYFTNQLGFEYLWIDSLCIIQDDEDDWLKESALMGEVYRNGACNLAASAAATGISEGLFADRDPSVLSAAFVTFERKGVRAPAFCYTDAIMPSRNSMALCQRGWVMQERLLSPRTVYFDEQLVWECHEMVGCEVFPCSFGRVVSRRRDETEGEGGTPFKIGSLQADLRKSMGMYEFQTQWLRIIEGYSHNSLTYESDILPATSGVAKYMDEQLRGEYVAGLWKEDIHRSLLWFIDANSVTYPEEYRAPSWSWAAVKEPVKFIMRDQYNKPFEDFSKEMEVLEARVKLVSADPHGRIADASLVVSGALREARKPRVDHVESGPGSTILYDLFDNQTAVTSVQHEGDQDTIYYLLVVTTEYGKTMGLILEAVNRELGQYRRIGVFKHGWDNITGEPMPDLEEFSGHFPGGALDQQVITII
ncbi:MAG: hypothetical protein Q9160_008400 [Pyrenula sp. 1 TL-2023]